MNIYYTSVIKEDIRFFVEDLDVRKGHILSSNMRYPNHINMVGLLHKNPSYPVVGISLQDVIHFDPTKDFIHDYHMTPDGSKIRIMTQGKIRWMFPTELALPRLQPIYADFKTSFPTWRYSREKIGYLDAPQDQDGYCTINIDFEKYR